MANIYKGGAGTAGSNEGGSAVLAERCRRDAEQTVHVARQMALGAPAAVAG